MTSGTPFTLEVNPSFRAASRGWRSSPTTCWYSWDRPTRPLFSRLDPQLWDEVGHNPKAFLKRVDEQKLVDAADDPVFLGNLQPGAVRIRRLPRSEPLRRNGSEWLR